MFKLCFYVPVDDAEAVKQAVFASGAGRIGNYEACCWQSLGEGQFRPLAGATPSIGEIDGLQKVAEAKIELVCDDSLIKQAVAAMLAAHPYEEPAYQIWPVITLDEL